MGAPFTWFIIFCYYFIHNFHSYCYIFIFDLMHHLRKSCTDPLYSCDDSQTCCPVDFVSMLLQIARNSFWLKAWNQHLLKWWNIWRSLSIINYAHDLFSWTRADLDVAHLEEMQSAVPTRWETKKKKKIQKINVNKNEKKHWPKMQSAVWTRWKQELNIRQTIKTQIRKKKGIDNESDWETISTADCTNKKQGEREASLEGIDAQPHGYKNYLKRNKQDIWNILNIWTPTKFHKNKDNYNG